MLIRKADPSDARGIARILHALGHFSHLAGEPEEETTSRVGERLRSCEATREYVLVATEGDQILAYGVLRLSPGFILKGWDAYLSELFCLPEASGRGLGTAILNAIEAEARRLGCPRLWCINFKQRDSYTRSYYAKQGWSEGDIAVFMKQLGG